MGAVLYGDTNIQRKKDRESACLCEREENKEERRELPALLVMSAIFHKLTPYKSGRLNTVMLLVALWVVADSKSWDDGKGFVVITIFSRDMLQNSRNMENSKSFKKTFI